MDRILQSSQNQNHPFLFNGFTPSQTPARRDGFLPVAHTFEADLVPLSLHQRTVLRAYCKLTDGFRWACRLISLADLAELTKLSRRTVIRTLQELRALNLVTWEERWQPPHFAARRRGRPPGRERAPNQYLFPKAEEWDGTRRKAAGMESKPGSQTAAESVIETKDLPCQVVSGRHYGSVPVALLSNKTEEKNIQQASNPVPEESPVIVEQTDPVPGLPACQTKTEAAPTPTTEAPQPANLERLTAELERICRECSQDSPLPDESLTAIREAAKKANVTLEAVAAVAATKPPNHFRKIGGLVYLAGSAEVKRLQKRIDHFSTPANEPEPEMVECPDCQGQGLLPPAMIDGRMTSKWCTCNCGLVPAPTTTPAPTIAPAPLSGPARPSSAEPDAWPDLANFETGTVN